MIQVAQDICLPGDELNMVGLKGFYDALAIFRPINIFIGFV